MMTNWGVDTDHRLLLRELRRKQTERKKTAKNVTLAFRMDSNEIYDKIYNM